MALTIITKNSVVASKRPTPAQLVTGELGLNANAADPGLYFEDSAGNIRKVGGCHYGATAPNVTAAGQTGNSVGELWYDTSSAKLRVWDGATWTIAGGSDTQSFYLAGPWATGVNRPDGQPLLAGDEWYDTSTTPPTSYIWDGLAWSYFASGDTHSFTGAGDPIVTNPVTLRPDGSALQDGDIYIDTTSQVGYYYNLALTTWTLFGSDTHAFVSDTALVTRPNGSALVPGDIWFDSVNLEAFVWYFDGTSSQWVSLVAGSIAPLNSVILAAVAPTLRTDGTALQQGDLWENTAIGRLFYYTGAIWSPSGTHNFAQDATPTAFVYPGDTWYDTTNLLSFVYYDDGSSSQWIQI